MIGREPFDKAGKDLSMNLSVTSVRAIFTIQECGRLERQMPHEQSNELPNILQLQKLKHNSHAEGSHKR